MPTRPGCARSREATSCASRRRPTSTTLTAGTSGSATKGAGKVWATGQAKAVDSLKKHAWFKRRKGCENETYLCVPVGPPGGAEGVLAVGSDTGFDVRAGDLGLLHAYGALLALAMP